MLCQCIIEDKLVTHCFQWENNGKCVASTDVKRSMLFFSSPIRNNRHWKAISMRVGIGLGDTYGPMHYPGMRSLWQSPANFHQHLAFPPPFSSPGPPTCFLFLLLRLLLPLQTLLACYCPRMVTIIRNRKKKSAVSSECGTKLKMCNHTVLFPIMKEVIVDTSRGENILDSALLVYSKTEPRKYPKPTE